MTLPKSEKLAFQVSPQSRDYIDARLREHNELIRGKIETILHKMKQLEARTATDLGNVKAEVNDALATLKLMPSHRRSLQSLLDKLEDRNG